jgi:lysozyme family protein
MDAFMDAVTFTLEWEGGLVDHPNDPGGRTNFGLSQRQFPDLDLSTLTRQNAIAIYFQEYWVPIRGDELPPAVAFALFDFAVNSGVSRAIRTLQRIVHVRVDGALGPKTLHALSFYSHVKVLSQIMQHRAELLLRLASKPQFKPFARGWARRVVDCAVRAGALR